MKKLQKVIVVAGPTASGKSDFAVQLALKNNGEIISADSRQIYKGLDIGTGKITKKEMRSVNHHMLDIINLGDSFSVAEYRKRATSILEDILARGKTPIICGGTGQYIDSLIFNTSIPEVAPDKKLREKLEKKTTEALYKLLLSKDSRRAKEIDKHNRVRLIRALEIVESLGKVPRQNKPKLKYDVEMYLMSPTREILRERIIKRLDIRLKSKMIDEVKNLITHLGPSSVDMRKFGLEYVTISKFLEGKLSKERMKEELTNKINQYAKRQVTWNKKYVKMATPVPVE